MQIKATIPPSDQKRLRKIALTHERIVCG